MTDLLEVAEGLFLDGRQTTGDVALRRLGIGEIVGLVRLDDVLLVGLPHREPFVGDLGRTRARLAKMLGAGDFRRLAEHAVDADRDQLVVEIADRRAGRQGPSSYRIRRISSKSRDRRWGTSRVAARSPIGRSAWPRRPPWRSWRCRRGLRCRSRSPACRSWRCPRRPGWSIGPRFRSPRRRRRSGSIPCRSGCGSGCRDPRRTAGGRRRAATPSSL